MYLKEMMRVKAIMVLTLFISQVIILVSQITISRNLDRINKK